MMRGMADPDPLHAFQVNIFELGEPTRTMDTKAKSREEAIGVCLESHFGPWSRWEFVLREDGTRTGECRVTWEGFGGEHVSIVMIQAMGVSDDGKGLVWRD